MNPDEEFWRGKHVLVTGHTGFKGGWLSLWLRRMGAEVTGYSLEPPTNPNLFEAAGLERLVNSVHGDVRDLAHLDRVIADSCPDVVFHMAAQPLVRYSYSNPVETFETNVLGTVKLLEAIRHQGNVKAVVCITTDKCYENREWVWGYRENDPMGGYDPYSSSKGCAELAVSAYRRSYFSTANTAAIASVRAGNVIGGGDWASDRLVPDTMRAYMQGKEVVIRNPHAIRPWQHVLEPLCGYLILAEQLCLDEATFAGGWNFGPHDYDAKPVEWIVDYLSQLWSDGASWSLDGAEHPHEAQYLKLDISKALTVLGYQPRLDLRTALEWVTEWYKAYSNEADMRVITEQQIARFERLDPE